MKYKKRLFEAFLYLQCECQWCIISIQLNYNLNCNGCLHLQATCVALTLFVSNYWSQTLQASQPTHIIAKEPDS